MKSHHIFVFFLVTILLSIGNIGLSQSEPVNQGSDNSDIKQVKALRFELLETGASSFEGLEKYLESTKLKAINQENPELLAQVSYNLGLLYFDTRNYIKAIPPLQSALDNIKTLNFRDSLVLYNNITISFTEIKAYNSAIRYVGTLEALINKNPSEYKKIKNNIISLDGLYYNLGMYQDAIRVFRRKKRNGNNLNKSKPYQYAVDLFDFGRYFSANQQPDSALHYYQMSRNIVESSNFETKDYFLGLIKGEIAEAFIQQEKYEEAIPLLKEEYVTSLRAKDFVNSTRSLNILAYCEFQTGDLDNALRHLQGVRELINKNDAPDVFITNTLYLSQAFSALSQYDSAYYYSRSYIQQRDSISSSRNIEKSAQLSVSAELQHKEQIMQKALLQMHKVKEESQQNQNIIYWVLIASAILSILFIGTLFLLQRKSTQKSKLQNLIIDYEQKTKEVERSLSEKEYLLKEIHHRVKNNLQIVSGLLQLQAIHSKNKEFKNIMKQSQNRIKSMALIHQMIYQNEDIRYIPFKSYLEKLSSQIMSSMLIDVNRIKINIIIKEIKLDVETAIPLGIIVNELLSNALKYAYPDKSSGNIDIWLKQEEDDQFTLTVNDDGPGLPEGFDIEEGKSLGLQLVDMLSKQMNSKLTYKYNNGAEFSIKFTVKNLNNEL